MIINIVLSSGETRRINNMHTLEVTRDAVFGKNSAGPFPHLLLQYYPETGWYYQGSHKEEPVKSWNIQD